MRDRAGWSRTPCGRRIRSRTPPLHSRPTRRALQSASASTQFRQPLRQLGQDAAVTMVPTPGFVAGHRARSPQISALPEISGALRQPTISTSRSSPRLLGRRNSPRCGDVAGTASGRRGRRCRCRGVRTSLQCRRSRCRHHRRSRHRRHPRPARRTRRPPSVWLAGLSAPRRFVRPAPPESSMSPSSMRRWLRSSTLLDHSRRPPCRSPRRPRSPHERRSQIEFAGVELLDEEPGKVVIVDPSTGGILRSGSAPHPVGTEVDP